MLILFSGYYILISLTSSSNFWGTSLSCLVRDMLCLGVRCHFIFTVFLMRSLKSFIKDNERLKEDDEWFYF
jgi:hypothetical protein